MCGIAGATLRADSTIDPRLLAASMALGIESRGPDATGVSWFDEDAHIVRFHKRAVTASEFVADIFEHMAPSTRQFILHTRFWTTGPPDVAENNHPIYVPSADLSSFVVGVHNGCINNHHQIAARYEMDRRGEVDSEVIFQLLANHGGVETVAAELEGTAAIAWMRWSERIRPAIHVARLSSSPVVTGRLYVADDYRLNGWVFASTSEALRVTEHESGYEIGSGPCDHLVEGDVFSFDGGHVTEQERISIKMRRGGGGDWQSGRMTVTQTLAIAPPTPPTPTHTLATDLDAIMASIAFGDTHRSEWSYECDNEHSDALWYNATIDCWAIVDGQTGDVCHGSRNLWEMAFGGEWPGETIDDVYPAQARFDDPDAIDDTYFSTYFESDRSYL